MPNGELYTNTDRCWQFLCVAAKAARYLGLVPIADIADHKNPKPHVLAESQREPNARYWVETPELAEPYIYINGGDGYNFAKVQPYHMEVWVEKSTMNDVLLCQRFLTNLVTGEGEMTITAVHALVERIKAAGKPTRIFYGSDFDPAGSMPCAVARKVEYMLRTQNLDIDVRLHRLLLNREHVDDYALPRTPIKESEKRAATFEARHGEGCVELDALEALHPGVLYRIVADALSHYFSAKADAAAREKERALRRAIREQVPGGAANLPGSPLASTDLEKLARCGIPAALAQQAFLRRVKSQEGGQIVGRNGAGDYSGLVFPYIWPGEGRPREYRLRRDHPDLEIQPDGSHKERAKYVGPPGRGNLLYFFPDTPAEFKRGILVTEIESGEILVDAILPRGDAYKHTRR